MISQNHTSLDQEKGKMVLDSIPWKEELQKLCDELTSIKLPFEYDEDDQSDFLIERALLYSAFVARLLLDARKVTDSLNSCCMPVGIIPNSLENPEHIIPLFRRIPEHDYYDFENETIKSISCRKILNQIIHSFVIPTYEVDKTGSVIGFFVSSDMQANTQLFHVKLEHCIIFLQKIKHDDITSIKTYFDEKKDKWIEIKA